MKNIYLPFFIYIFLIYANSNLFSDILSDISKDREISIKIKKDTTGDSTTDKTKDATTDFEFGNKWYSRQNIYIFHSLEIGLSGTKDYLTEYALFKYRFVSKNKHAFAMRFSHLGYSPGLFTINNKLFNFGFFGGFEYLLKILVILKEYTFGLKIGGCNKGIAFNAGIGIGNRLANGLEIGVFYFHNIGIFPRLDFYFLLIKALTLRGQLGIDYNYTNKTTDIFTFFNGFYIGFSIKDIFRMEFGGGFTLNEYSYFSGYGGLNFSLSFL